MVLQFAEMVISTRYGLIVQDCHRAVCDYVYTRQKDVFRHSPSNCRQELCGVHNWIRQNDNRICKKTWRWSVKRLILVVIVRFFYNPRPPASSFLYDLSSHQFTASSITSFQNGGLYTNRLSLVLRFRTYVRLNLLHGDKAKMGEFVCVCKRIVRYTSLVENCLQVHDLQSA